MSQPESTRLACQAYAAFLQNEPEARTLVDELYRRFPSDPNAIIIAAEFAAKKFEHQRAIELYQQLPKDSARWELAASLGLAKRYRVLGKQLEEEAVLQRAIEIDPVNMEANHRLGHLLQVQGRTWESIRSFMNQIRRGKCRGDELMGIASTERFFRADEEIEFAVARSTPREAVTQLGNARRFLFENRNAEAETLLGEIVAESPEIGEAQGRMGRLLVESGRLAEFFDWLKKLPDAAKQHPEVWFVQGLQARRLGDIRGASHCFLQTIRLSPNHLPATVQLAACLEQIDQSQMASFFRQRSEVLSELESQLNILRFSVDELLMDKVAERFAKIGRYWEAAGWMYVRSTVSPIPPELVASARHWTKMAKQSPDQNQGFLETLDSAGLDSLPRPDWDHLMSINPDVPRSPSEEPLTSTTDLKFVEEAQQLGLNFQYFEGTTEENRLNHIFSVVGGGVGVLDFDLDLWPDLHFAQGNDWRSTASADKHRDVLFRNVRGTGFVDCAVASGVLEFGFSHGVTVEDFDQDGFPDLYICNLGGNRLFRNLGDGSFEDVTEQSGTAGSEWSIGGIFADVNGDTLPDLYVGNYTLAEETRNRICHRPGGREMACTPDVLTAESDRLYLNLGDGRFRDVTEDSGVKEASGRALGMIGWDFFGDGRMSFFVANDTSANFLWRQTEVKQLDGLAVPRFEDEGIVQGVAFDADGNAQACMGVASGDINQDGLIDLFITNFSNESNTLYVQNPDHSFLDKTRQYELRDASFAMLGFGTQFLDVNFDGWPDIVAANGHVDQSETQPNADRMPPQLFLNRGGQIFEEQRLPAGTPYFSRPTLGRGLATLDWNRDGRTDFVVTHVHDPVALVSNQTALPGKVTTVRLLGRTSAGSAVGARIRSTVSGRDSYGLVTAGDGYLVSNESVFPLYSHGAEQDFSVEVTWPIGTRQEWHLRVVEDDILLMEGRGVAYRMPK